METLSGDPDHAYRVSMARKIRELRREHETDVKLMWMQTFTLLIVTVGFIYATH